MSNFAKEQAVLAQASNAVAAALELPVGEGYVTIGTGISPNNDLYSAEREHKDTNMVITIKGLGVDLDQKTAETNVLKALDQFPDLKKFLQLKFDEELVIAISKKLKNAAQGTDFDKYILAWSPFINPEIIKDGNEYAIPNHAIDDMSMNAYGVTCSMRVPVDKNTDPKELTEKVDANIKSRLPEIKATLTECTIKYITKNLQADGKSEAEIAQEVEKVKAEMEKLHISVNLDNQGTRVEISIRSTQQEEAFKHKTGNSWEMRDDADKLKGSNPLSELSQMVSEDKKKTDPDASSQIEKALGRSFLYGGGEKAMEVFPLIAGKRDILNAIAREAKKFPEKAALFDEILASDLFKKRGWGVEKGDAAAAPAKPIFMKHYDKPDTLELWIKTEKGKEQQILNAFIGDGQQLPPTSSISPENFKKPEGKWLANLLAGITGNSQQPQLSYR